jgi:hypothetical protein
MEAAFRGGFRLQADQMRLNAEMNIASSAILRSTRATRFLSSQ